MEKRKIVLVGRDQAPSEAFQRLAEELAEDDSIHVISFLGFGKPIQGIDEDFEQIFCAAIESASIVVIGMSSSLELAEPEIAAAQYAAGAGIPFGFYCDTFGCHNRSWFSQFRSDEYADFLFVINEKEAGRAREVFPLSEVVVSGNPRWEDFVFPKFTRQEVRAKLGVAEKEKMILVPGGKIPAINIILWEAVMSAVHLSSVPGVKIFLSRHPGDYPKDEMEAKWLEKVYGDLVKFRGRVDVNFLDRGTKTSDVLPGTDLLVESASTLGIEAAFQRIPVIDYFSRLALNRMKETSGTIDWELCAQEAAMRIDEGGEDSLLDVIEFLLSHNDPVGYLVEAQEENYPVPAEKGTAVRIMADTIRIRGYIEK